MTTLISWSQPQVRHECAEALGDIPGVEIEAEMAKYLDPKVDPVVRESCVVGTQYPFSLDFMKYHPLPADGIGQC